MTLFSYTHTGCVQLLKIVEIYWNLKSILEVLEVSWNLILSVEIAYGTSARAFSHKIFALMQLTCHYGRPA